MLSQLLIVGGATAVLGSLIFVALEAIDDTGWFSEHNTETTFAKAFRHLFWHNLNYTRAKYTLAFGVVATSAGVFLMLTL